MPIDKTAMYEMLPKIKRQDAEMRQQIEDLKKMRVDLDSHINNIILKNIDMADLVGCQYTRTRSGWCSKPEWKILEKSDNGANDKVEINLLKHLSFYTLDKGEFFNSLCLFQSIEEEEYGIFEKDELYIAFFQEDDFIGIPQGVESVVNREKSIYEIVVIKLP